jgi:transcriptional regulator with XRE-family HTH domain
MFWHDRHDVMTTKGLRLLGETFLRLRISRHFSQAALGGRIGLSQASISRFETGKQPGLSARWLGRMMVVLEISSDELEGHIRVARLPLGMYPNDLDGPDQAG